MKRNSLLLCSALFAAPLCGLFANDANSTSEKPTPAAIELREEALADLSIAFKLSSAIEGIDEQSATDFLSANPIPKFSVLMQRPIMARSQKSKEPQITETLAADPFETSANPPPNGHTQEKSIKISNT